MESNVPVVLSFQKKILIDDRILRLIFKDRIDTYSQTVESGKNNATAQLLGALEGDIPLQRWRKDLAQGRMNLLMTTSGEFKGHLPTKIPEVYLEYNYTDESKSMPQLAILVDPLK